MEISQKAIIVTTSSEATDGLDELNLALSRGWRVVRATAMGGAGVGQQTDEPALRFAALVIIERADESMEEQISQAEEEYNDLLENLVEDPTGKVSRRPDFIKKN